jgi:hypothetical protein
MISSSNELKGNSEYFIELTKQIDDSNVIKSFYEYLKKILYMNKFNSIPIPMTEYQKFLCELSITLVEAVVKDLVSNTQQLKLNYTTKELFGLFNSFLHESKSKYDLKIFKFGVRLANLKLEGISTVHARGGNMKQFDVPTLKKNFGIGCLL